MAEVVAQKPKKEEMRPKSRKELRTEKKAAKKAATISVESTSKEDERMGKKEHRKAIRKENDRQMLKQLRKEKKLRKQKKLRREMNASGVVHAAHKSLPEKEGDTPNKKETKSPQEQEFATKVLNQVLYGSNNDTTGATTLRLGVIYMDVVEGKGPEAQHQDLVTVKYKLTAGKFGATIDSSSKFSFRLGKGEVIQGWDIGMVGMRVGGKRQLIVPPKAGYGGQDIGAGPGATLFFDITLLACR
jgi:FKBP-type peptidyl-prolyl cis-trans isomerase